MRLSGPRVLLAVVVAVVAAAIGVDVAMPPTSESAVGPVPASLAAGASTCAATGPGEVVAITATSPDRDDTGDDPGDEATATLQSEQDGTITSLADPAVEGGTTATGVDGEGALAARWTQVPLLLSRTWAVDDDERVPGVVAGPCPQEASRQWHVPGVATAGGAAAELHLANPTAAPASLAVTLTTPDGPVAPTRLANLTVAAHDRITVDLNEFAPEEPDLGVVVQARSGRVVAEAVQTFEAAVGGVDGRSLVTAHAAPRAVWTIPWVTTSEQESAWIWVTNPGEEATDVRLVVHTPDGPVVPPASGVTLAPGSTQRIDLRGALEGQGAVGVTVRAAEEVPVVASGAVLRAVEEDPTRGGVAVVEGLLAQGGRHAALAIGTDGAERQLVLTNPAEEPATVDVELVGPDAAAAQAVTNQADVPAGATLVVDLGDQVPTSGPFAVVVDITGGAVSATLVSRTAEGPLDLLAIAARPFPAEVLVAEPQWQLDRTLPIDGLPTPTPSPTEPDPAAP